MNSNLDSKIVDGLIFSIGPAWIGTNFDKYIQLYMILRMIPAFLMSVFIEYLILKRYL